MRDLVLCCVVLVLCCVVLENLVLGCVKAELLITSLSLSLPPSSLFGTFGFLFKRESELVILVDSC